eukprot:CAMPEP_0177614336 /NCGR_PEP_ID=MMETSP0419_2-20121207/22631_1 /TAXON_ID=582737 /ORGANISM="Tetraselmis sp., Strain GSL018" /LENGTH=45 /DNA_ID= /DNA_START= /DNA_END= /DNA_ORIENTATION=
MTEEDNEDAQDQNMCCQQDRVWNRKPACLGQVKVMTWTRATVSRT